MPLLPPSTFRERVSSLNTDAFRAFVADIWSARGFETKIKGCVVSATHPDERKTRELIAVEPQGGPADWDAPTPSWEVDIIVSRADASGDGVGSWAGQRRVLGSDDIREMLLYAVPREDAAVIARQHLDCELTTAAPSAFSQDTDGVHDAVPVRSTWLILASAVLVAVVVVTATVGGPSFGFEQSSREDATGATSTPAPTPDLGNTVEGSRMAEVPCLETPTEAIQYQLDVLDNDSGVRTVWEFGTQEFRRYSGTYREFNISMHSHPFEHLLTPTRVVNGTVERSAATATGEVAVLDTGGVQYNYTFILSLVDEKWTGFWRTDGLIYNQS